MKKRIFAFSLAAFMLCGSFSGCGLKKGPASISGKEETEQYVRYLGRTYTSSNTTYFNWTLGGFEVNFHGTGLTAKLHTSLGYDGMSLENNTMLCIYVDGENEPSKTISLDEEIADYVLCEGLEKDDHTVKVLKRHDVGYATAGLETLTVTDGTFHEKPVSTAVHRIEFLGDSLTSGDGCYTYEDCAWISINQDGTLSHAKLIGDAFNADIQVLSHCGMGLVWDYAGHDMNQGAIPLTAIYNYSDYFNRGMESEWDFSKFRPELIVLNIGTNDFNYICGHPEMFYDAYVSFLQTIREKNPDAFILCTMGTTASENVDPGFTQIAEKANAAGLTNIEFFMMPKDYDPERDEPGIGIHPSPKSQARTADYLIEEIKRVLGWQTY